MDVMRHCGVVVVPKSTHVERVCENLDIWNFGLQAGPSLAFSTTTL
ncbi:MAG: hypothetical protein IKG18_09215 [Atopobiaceae bacterium]|nr:hypothetical protein [Atopobiaceae bacterium]